MKVYHLSVYTHHNFNRQIPRSVHMFFIEYVAAL